MEEDIKVLEDINKAIEYLENYKYDNDVYKAIQVLIKGYKELEKQIDLEWVEDNYIEKSKYKELQEKIDDLLSQNEMFKNMYDEEVYKNKKLEERSNRINEQNIKYQNTLEKLQKETIWKSKVREKIEENKWASEGYDSDTADYGQSQAIGAYIALIELLQEGDK